MQQDYRTDNKTLNYVRTWFKAKACHCRTHDQETAADRSEKQKWVK